MPPETAPCPWCEDGGKPFPHRIQHPYFAYAIKCCSCGAEGPNVRFDPNVNRQTWEEITAPAIEEARARWNARALPAQPVLEVVEDTELQPVAEAS